jgi:hypothetical protein
MAKTEKKGEVISPPHSPPREALPSLGDIFSRQVGTAVSAHQSKWPRAEIEPSTGSPSQPHLTLVSSGLRGMSDVPMLTKPTYLFGVL